jgi:hypothetical protein
MNPDAPQGTPTPTPTMPPTPEQTPPPPPDQSPVPPPATGPIGDPSTPTPTVSQQPLSGGMPKQSKKPIKMIGIIAGIVVILIIIVYFLSK